MTARGQRAADRGEEMEISFLEALRRRRPADRRILEVLGDLYTRTGRFEEGLEVDLRLSREHPSEPLIWYNLGCSLALVGRKEEAFDALGRAIELGYADVNWMLKDDDLASLRSDPRFKALVKETPS